MQRHSYFARQNAKKVAQEVGISLSTLERNYGIYLDKTVQEKVQQEVRRNRGRKQKAMIQRRVMASPTGFEPKLIKKSGS